MHGHRVRKATSRCESEVTQARLRGHAAAHGDEDKRLACHQPQKLADEAKLPYEAHISEIPHTAVSAMA